MAFFKRPLQNWLNDREMRREKFKIDPILDFEELLDDADIWEGLPAPQPAGRPEQRHPPKQPVPKRAGWEAILNKVMKGVTNSIYLPVPSAVTPEVYQATIEMHLEELDPFTDLKVEIAEGPVARGQRLYSLHVFRGAN